MDFAEFQYVWIYLFAPVVASFTAAYVYNNFYDVNDSNSKINSKEMADIPDSDK